MRPEKSSCGREPESVAAERTQEREQDKDMQENQKLEKEHLAIVTLKKGEGRTIKAGGAWIFDNEIASVAGHFENGDIVLVHDFDGYPMGKGFINQNSKIRIRMMTRRVDTVIDGAFHALSQSCRQPGITGKARWIPPAAAWYLGSGFSAGMTIDKYEDILVVESLALGIDRMKETIVELLKEILAADGVRIRACMSAAMRRSV